MGRGVSAVALDPWLTMCKVPAAVRPFAADGGCGAPEGHPIMSTNDPNDLERIDQAIRINELKHEAEESAGGEMTAWESDDCPPDVSEQFWREVVAYEKAPWTSHFQQLAEAGVELPAPDSLDDARLTAKLWEIVNRLASMRVFLTQTNHLSDRDLYALLWGEVLHEATKAIPYDEFSACNIDLLTSGSEEDAYLYLKYYADEEWRRDWHEQFPEDEMPPHEDPPYERDRLLPQATYGVPSDEEVQEFDAG